MPDFTVKGWCPGALQPMVSGDGLVVRIRPRLAHLTAAQLRGIAQAALSFGNGIVELTARANLQLRGVTLQSHAPLIAALDALELIDPDALTERHRNVVISPFWHGEVDETLVTDLYKSLSQLPDLPNKFGFAIDCGVQRVLADTSADIRIERGAFGGLILRADGALGGQIVTKETAVPEALRMAEWFLASGGVKDGRGRMAAHLPRAMPFDIGHLPGDIAPKAIPGITPYGALIAFEFGILQAEVLADLADLAPSFRVTPWRMLLLQGASVPVHPSLIATADDPRLRVVACTGAPGCPQALQETRALARRLAPAVPMGKLLHVSGCGKGCAHQGVADLTLCATGQGFTVLTKAKAGDSGPVLTASLITFETISKAM